MTSHSFSLLPVGSIFQVTDTSVTGTIFPEAWISSFCLCLIRSCVSPTSNAHPTHIYTDVFHTHTDVFHTWPSRTSSLTPLAETDMVRFSAFYLTPAFQNPQQKSKGRWTLFCLSWSLPGSGLPRRFQQTDLVSTAIEHTSLQVLSPLG